MVRIKLSDRQKEILNADGHLLVQGGPGSGKTTVSILKAAQLIKQGLKDGQRVLFLSFARATVSRVIEALNQEPTVDPQVRKSIEVDTYHAFFWRLIRSHGYLLGLPRCVNVLTPSAEAVALSDLRIGFNENDEMDEETREQKVYSERIRLAKKHGSVSFALFAELACNLLENSSKIRRLISNAYPILILDEFQDTALNQWRAIKALGGDCRLIALADPEQRIFDFAGADPERIEHFITEFSPSEYDLADDNHRSRGTDLTIFGNDILLGAFSQESYDGVDFCTYDANQNKAMAKVVGKTLQARNRLIESGVEGWSLAILVPTKRLARLVSEALRNPPGRLPSVRHSAAIDLDAAILAAEVIAFILQENGTKGGVDLFIEHICCYFRGKGGTNPTKTGLNEAESISMAFSKALEQRAAGKDVNKRSIFLPIEKAYKEILSIKFTGDPDADWTTVRNFLDNVSCKRLKEISAEVRNIRILDRGTQLREQLSQNWRDNGAYTDALEIVKRSFVREHFSVRKRPESGVIVMNMHKAKGKQFDEVIIFEGWPRRHRRKIVGNPDRIIRGNDPKNVNDQALQNFRVSVTRAKLRTTIITPNSDCCVLLTNNRNQD